MNHQPDSRHRNTKSLQRKPRIDACTPQARRREQVLLVGGLNDRHRTPRLAICCTVPTSSASCMRGVIATGLRAGLYGIFRSSDSLSPITDHTQRYVHECSARDAHARAHGQGLGTYSTVPTYRRISVPPHQQKSNNDDAYTRR